MNKVAWFFNQVFISIRRDEIREMFGDNCSKTPYVLYDHTRWVRFQDFINEALKPIRVGNVTLNESTHIIVCSIDKWTNECHNIISQYFTDYQIDFGPQNTDGSYGLLLYLSYEPAEEV